MNERLCSNIGMPSSLRRPDGIRRPASLIAYSAGMSPEHTRLRLADLARQAGVSEATVSRVLNDRPGVSESARQAVLVALEVLGYQRPERLRRRSAGLVGLVTPELDNPIFPLFAQTI